MFEMVYAMTMICNVTDTLSHRLSLSIVVNVCSFSFSEGDAGGRSARSIHGGSNDSNSNNDNSRRSETGQTINRQTTIPPANNGNTFLAPSDLHPNMINRDEDVMQLRLLAGKLSADWRGQDFMAPALARRIRDFQFAQEKRRRKYGDERPWGILGLYDHLASIRVDVEWAEDAAWRRANGEPYVSVCLVCNVRNHFHI